MSFITSQTGQALSSIGQGAAGIGQFIGARQETEVGDFNAGIFRQKAQAERSSQDLLEQQKRRITKSQIGTQIALFAKSGVKLTGSPIDLLTEDLTNAEMDIAIDQYNSEIVARGFETEARLEKVRAKQRSAVALAKSSRTFLSTAFDLLQSQQKIGGKGKQLGAGTTSQGISVPSRFVPPK